MQNITLSHLQKWFTNQFNVIWVYEPLWCTKHKSCVLLLINTLLDPSINQKGIRQIKK